MITYFLYDLLPLWLGKLGRIARDSALYRLAAGLWRFPAKLVRESCCARLWQGSRRLRQWTESSLLCAAMDAVIRWLTEFVGKCFGGIVRLGGGSLFCSRRLPSVVRLRGSFFFAGDRPWQFEDGYLENVHVDVRFCLGVLLDGLQRENRVETCDVGAVGPFGKRHLLVRHDDFSHGCIVPAGGENRWNSNKKCRPQCLHAPKNTISLAKMAKFF
jgi:hypothetical protein